jgi:O-antigen ligase
MTSAIGAGLIVSWTLFVFGAVYPWASRPAAAATLLLFAFARPPLFRDRTFAVDLSITAVLAFCWLQLVPLPPSVVNALSPASDAFHRAVDLSAFDPLRWRPLSLAPAASLDALIVLTAGALFYWITRDSLGNSGARVLARWIAFTASACVVLAALSPALFPNGLIYGFWRPQDIHAQPVGPIVSRNHFAAWMLVAAPIVGGYLAARARSHWLATSVKQSSLRALTDSRAFFTVGAVALIAGGVVMSQSRAGLIGLAAATLFALVGGWRQFGRRGRFGLVSLVAGLSLGALVIAHPARVVNRFGDTTDDSWGGRPMIWRTSRALVARYPLTGVGFGAYEGAMPLYQPEPRGMMMNHAHDQYLEIAAEGGIPGLALFLIALVMVIRLHIRRQRHDHSAHRYLRSGALVGLVGLAVQSIWETPLLTPAVVWLAAAAAGLATSRPANSSGSSNSSHSPDAFAAGRH